MVEKELENLTSLRKIFMENNIDPLVEWAVWGHLDSKNDLELLLLKGHLLIEIILQTVLKRNNITESENYSFHRKIVALERITVVDNEENKRLIIQYLKSINRIRNKIAHDFHFDINNGEFEKWASDILNNLQGTKYTKYTYRTRLVHSFSILSKNILELTDEI
ncbi:hypothetical protein ACFE6N_12170 [Pedobacter sp. BG31]|uniref:hypothetical protein n=1 Tax=Pedobacter sp. BG31 TaxID=3349697 RepID=UPI0035F238EC